MEKILLRRIFCVLVAAFFVLPINVAVADGTVGVPDLSVETVGYTPLYPKDGDIVTVFVNVMNNGDIDATGVNVTFICDHINNTIGVENIEMLEAGSSIDVSIDWMASAGDHKIIAVVDSEDAVIESDEGNNENDVILFVAEEDGSYEGDGDGSDGGKGSTYSNTWCEAESWDRSWDSYYGTNWVIKGATRASNGEYTRQKNKLGTGDYAEWDFTVNTAGTYYFWVRGFHSSEGCKNVKLFWNGEQIGSYKNWYRLIGPSWGWSSFGSKYLSTGSGTLKIRADQRYYIEVDNILITDNPNYTPSGKGVEGSTNHTIGYGCNTPPTANDDTASTDEDIPVWIDVLSNDYDSDGSLVPSTVTVASGPSNGGTTVNTTTGDIKYTPDSGFYGTDSFTYTVDDNDGATSNTATVFITVNEVVNDPPSLSSGHVNPGSGSTGTLFTYWVTYTDPEDDSPTKQKVYIDGSPHTMVFDSTYSNGIYLYHKYKYQTTLPVGDHNYYFVFNDGHNPDVRLPVSGSYSGPSVLPANQPPTLVNHGTIPVGGDTSTVFTYRLTYTDAEGDAPTKKKVYIDDQGFDMVKVGGDYMTGAAYNYETTLPAGDHMYYFVFNDGHNPDVRLPVGTATYSGPHVSGDNPEIDLDYNYILNVTKWLSNVTFTSYDIGELAKGRAFGTKGEHDSADEIEFWMDELGLNPTMEPITDRDSLYDHKYYDELDDKLQVNARGAKINDQSVECYISPRWNNSMTHPNGDRTALSYNFTPPPDLKIYHRPMDFFDYFTYEFLYDNQDEINNGDFDGFIPFLEFMIQEYENYYNFSFEELNESNAFGIFPWYSTVYGQYSSVNYKGNCTLGRSPFVYIGEDPAFNPNASVPAYYSWFSRPIIIKLIGNVAGLIERLIWYKTLGNCHGLLLYDFNDHTYDMNLEYLMALPTIYINGSIGKDINQSTGDYTLDFYVDQEWNPEVESYNVIGQINGTKDETVIVCCLYDNWWNQGTADSAIGMGMVLAIAKYYKDNNITPRRNIKFIAFGGEEYGMRGAYHYEADHLNDETVTTVIDLNQLGFNRTDPNCPLTLSIITNEAGELKNRVLEIASRTNYEERTGYTTGFRVITTNDWNPISDYKPFADACKWWLRPFNNRSCGTICFVKDTNWTLHHRDGLDHNAGDVIDYYNETDVNVTAEMILNVTKFFTVEKEGEIPLLTYSPDSYDFGNITKGSTNSASFDIWNSGLETLSYTLSESCSWVDVSPTSGTVGYEYEHDMITVSVDTSGLSDGHYHCDIVINSDGGDGIFPVDMDVVTPPTLSYDPISHDFGDMQEGETDSTTFDIWNSGTGTLDYSLSESCSWVTVSPMSGDSTGEHDTITVSIDTTGLSTGSHQCDISISSNGGSGVFTVCVNIVETPPTPVLSYNPTSHDFGDMQEGETDTTTFDIWNSGTGILTYSLSESCSWVTVAPTSGSSTGEHDTITVDIDTTGISIGSYSCNIQISSNGGDGVFTVDVNIIDGETEQIDQEQTIYNTDFSLVNKYCAQSFIPTISPLTKIELYIGKTGNPSSGITVSIRSLLIGADLASVSKTASEISSSMSWVEFDIPDLDVTTGNTYYIVVESSLGALSDCYKVGYSGSGNLYTDGTMYQYNFDFIPPDPLKDGGVEEGVPGEPVTPKWQTMLNCDLCFKTYGLLTNPVPILSYTPTQHDFGTLTQGDSASTSFEIWNSGTGTLSYSLSESCEWVTVSPLNGDSTGEHDTIIVGIDTSTLSEGSHNCDISIDGGAGGSGIFTVSVNIVLPAPVLSYTPTSHDFGDMLTDQTDTTSFEIWNSGTGTLSYSLSESYTWIEISPISGTSTGEHDIVTVDIDTTGLTEGTYTADISITSDGGNGVFTVTVNIVTSAPVLSYTPTQHDFGTLTQGDSASTSFEIWNSGTGTLEYTLSENDNWMTVTPTSGSSTGEHDTINVNIDTSSLTEGTYTGDITINSNGGTGIFTVSVQVILVSEQVDQEQTIYNTDFSLANKYCAQSFIPTISPLTKIELYIGKTGNPSSDITVSIRSLLTGADLTSVSKTAAEISTSMGWVEFDIPDLDLTTGDTYYIVVEASGTLMDYYKVGYSNSGNLYTDGTMYQYNLDFIPPDPLKDGSMEEDIPGGSITPGWQMMFNYDLCFKTYGIG